MEKIKFAFFGTSDFSIFVLDELKKAGPPVGGLPALIITAPDKPVGRKQVITPSPVKIWAQKNNIPCEQPKTLKDGIIEATLKQSEWDFFVVASYGKIIPQTIIDIPKHGIVNVHPSLLPLYRGASPIQYQILEGAKEVGVTIMLIDKDADHGPILAQEKITMPLPLPSSVELTKILGELGGKLLGETIPGYITGIVKPREQDHSKATFTKIITKEDGRIDLTNNPIENWRKFKAFDPWPGVYFWKDIKGKKMRIIIKDAEYINGTFVIKKVLPEGRTVMTYEDFLRGYKKENE